ncbi:cation-transporting P-type ATPase [Kocuria sp. CPCC 104605]
MDHLDVDPHTGLQCAQADARREHVGPNKLPDPARATWWCASSSTSTMS